ncbi:MAG: ABC transporter permease [Syntrophorhabdaceae bacterium]|nr:ABC transporter permease [Syntrophorhabdaceae bacterium]
MLAAIGRKVIAFFAFMGELLLIVLRSFIELRGFFHAGFRPVIRVLFKQILFTGIHAWTIIVVLFFMISVLVVTQIIVFTGAEGASLIGKVLVWLVVREIGPILIAVIVIARSGAAIATELALMKVNRELWALEVMGISASRYLVMPRVMGMAISLAMLALYGVVVSISGGFFVGSLAWKIPFSEFKQSLVPLSLTKEILFCAMKSFVFGLTIAAVCCRQGLSVEGDATQIPVAATTGVMRSLMMVFLVDAIASLAVFR